MDNDDRPVGRILSRREVLALMGSASAAALIAACAPNQAATAVPTTAGPATTAPTTVASTVAPTTAAVVQPTTAATQVAAAPTVTTVLPSCIVRPELTEGPYFVDEKIERTDIRSNTADGAVREGIPLDITFLVSRIDASGCTPLSGAVVDVWHCDALGVYSDVQDPGFSTAGQDWLRGYQVTDANGVAKFTTVYPGWYRGRAVHIHFKIRTDPSADVGEEFTSQFFFDEAVTDVVHAQEPYVERGYRTLLNEGDGIYRQSGGQLTLVPVQAGDGYATTFDIGLQAV